MLPGDPRVATAKLGKELAPDPLPGYRVSFVAQGNPRLAVGRCPLKRRIDDSGDATPGVDLLGDVAFIRRSDPLGSAKSLVLSLGVFAEDRKVDRRASRS